MFFGQPSVSIQYVGNAPPSGVAGCPTTDPSPRGSERRSILRGQVTEWTHSWAPRSRPVTWGWWRPPLRDVALHGWSRGSAPNLGCVESPASELRATGKEPLDADIPLAGRADRVSSRRTEVSSAVQASPIGGSFDECSTAEDHARPGADGGWDARCEHGGRRRRGRGLPRRDLPVRDQYLRHVRVPDVLADH